MSKWRSFIEIKRLRYVAMVLGACLGIACPGGPGTVSLVSLNVMPTMPSIAKGTAQQFTAIGTFSDKSTQNLTNLVTWAAVDVSPSTGVASIAASGLASGLKSGQSTISATYMKLSATTVLTVTDVTLTSLGITPVNPTIGIGTSQQFVVKATFSDGTIQDVSNVANWTVSSDVAMINAMGLATGKKAGQTTVSATLMGISASTMLTVTGATIESIAVTPANPSIAKGTKQQFTAIATLSDKNTMDVSTVATWTAVDLSGSGVATISATGLATATEVGSANIVAVYMSASGNTTLTVSNAEVISVAVTPASTSVAKGGKLQFQATATLSDGTTPDVTGSAAWTAVDVAPATDVATIDAAGLATGKNLGSATITATLEGKSATATLTVLTPVVVTIAVSPSTAKIAKGRTQQFTAFATLSDATKVDVSSMASWTAVDVSGSGVANIDSAGLATATAAGSALITAAYEGISSTAELAVDPAEVVEIAVAPSTASIKKGESQQFTATATFSDTTTADITSTATWTALDASGSGIASINAAGLATGTGVGSAKITATSGGVSGTADLSVLPPTVIAVTVSPTTAMIGKGATQQFGALARFSDSSTLDVTNLATWSVADVVGSGIATIDASGLAKGTAIGNAKVTALYEGASGTAELTVTAAVPVSIEIGPAAPMIPRNMILQFQAIMKLSDGTTSDVTASAIWASENPAIAKLTSGGATTGRLIGVAPGTVNINASALGITGQIVATVSDCKVTINEVQVAGARGASDEWFELYNSCPFPLNLNNALIKYRSAAGSTDVDMVVFDAASSIAANGYLLYVGTAYPAGSPRDGTLTGGLAGAGGGLGLVYSREYTGGASTLIVDSVGYGTATNIYIEGTAALAPASGSSIRRLPDGTDTNNNRADFATTTTPTPRASNG